MNLTSIPAGVHQVLSLVAFVVNDLRRDFRSGSLLRKNAAVRPTNDPQSFLAPCPIVVAGFSLSLTKLLHLQSNVV